MGTIRSSEIRWHGINFGRVVAIHTYEKQLLRRLKLIAYALFVGFDLTIEQSRAPATCTFFYSAARKGRKDLNAMFSRAKELAGTGARSVSLGERYSFLQLASTISNLRAAYSAVESTAPTFGDRLFLTLLAAKYMSAYGALDDAVVRDGAGKLITFCDAFPYDNMVAQMAKLRNVSTYTMQHGQYRVLSERNISADAEAYLNFVSDYMLCWGGATVQEFSKLGIDRGRFIKVGRFRERVRSAQVPRSSSTGDTFGVVLNGENAAISNFGLLDAARHVARELNLRFIVRLHPANDSAKYVVKCDARCVGVQKMSDDEYFDLVDFSLAHMSSVVVEALERERAVFVLKDDLLADVFLVEGLAFDRDEIVQAIQRYRSEPLKSSEECRKLAKWFNDDSMQTEVMRSIAK